MDDRVGRLERTVDVLVQRVNTIDGWVEESREFHKDMNTFRDTLVAQQEAIREEQKLRHQSNSLKLNFIGIIVAIGTAVILALTAFIAYNQAKHVKVEPLTTIHQPKQLAHEELPLVSKEE